MSGNSYECSYYNCFRNMRDVPPPRQFRFPVKDEGRCQKWIMNSGNAELALLPEDILKRRFLCEDHFPSKYLFGKKLDSIAVPISYKEEMPTQVAPISLDSAHQHLRMTSGHICSYYNCYRTRRDVPRPRKFCFPVSNEARCQKWILNSGNALLAGLDEQRLQNRFLCELHFTKDQFLNTKLHKNAIPIPYNESSSPPTLPAPPTPPTPPPPPSPPSPPLCVNRSSSSRVYPVSLIKLHRLTAPEPCSNFELEQSDPLAIAKTDDDFLTKLTDLPFPPKPKKPVQRTDREMKYEARIAQYRRIIKTQNQRHRRLRSKLMRIKASGGHKVGSSIVLDKILESIPMFRRTLVKILLSNKAKTKWRAQDKEVCLQIYEKGPSLYESLLDDGAALPEIATVKKWIKRGFSSNVRLNLS